jgi:hypothetical protein
MIKISNLIEELKKFPPDSLAYAYEGESTCVVVCDKTRAELGYIPASELGRKGDGEAVIHKVSR